MIPHHNGLASPSGFFSSSSPTVSNSEHHYSLLGKASLYARQLNGPKHCYPHIRLSQQTVSFSKEAFSPLAEALAYWN